MTTLEAHPPVRRGRRGRRVVGIVLLILVLWIVLGLVRAPGVARDYYLSKQGGAQVTNLEESISPAIPPFWGVNIQANIGPTGAAYISAMYLWVEPFTGWIFSVATG